MDALSLLTFAMCLFGVVLGAGVLVAGIVWRPDPADEPDDEQRGGGGGNGPHRPPRRPLRPPSGGGLMAPPDLSAWRRSPALLRATGDRPRVMAQRTGRKEPVGCSSGSTVPSSSSASSLRSERRCPQMTSRSSARRCVSSSSASAGVPSAVA